jgi:poly(3-hydroxyalkanoate) depolymerase
MSATCPKDASAGADPSTAEPGRARSPVGAVAFADVRGQRLRFAVRGSGPPLLLIMGIGGHLEMWRPLIVELGAFQTIVFDMPGCGRSPTSRRPMRMGQLARLVEGLLDHLDLAQVDVLGFSYGGFVAQQLALQARSRVRRLVLAATSAGALSVPPPPHNIVRMMTPARYSSEAHFRRAAPSLFGGRIARDTAVLDAHFADRKAHPPSLGGYLSQLYSAWGWSSMPWLWRLRQPTLVMAGADDRLVCLANARALAAVLPDAHLHVVAQGGHLFLLDQAPDVAPVIARFLSA